MKRILAISDIHGEKAKLTALLEKAAYKPEEDQLVLLGAYIDRGPEPLATLFYVQELEKAGAKVLKGNHEDMFVNAYLEKHKRIPRNDHLRLHLDNGGDITWEHITLQDHIRQDPAWIAELVNYCDRLPDYFETDDYIFVHAGWTSGWSYGGVSEYRLWARSEFYMDAPNPEKIVIFGHTPTWYLRGSSRTEDASIWRIGNKIGIDCGACYGGRLACLELPTFKEYYWPPLAFCG